MVNESIIVGLVVGSAVAVIGAYIGYVFRLREMKALWAEEERRRKSDRRREDLEEDLRIVRDLVDALVESVDEMEWSAYAEKNLGRGARVELGRESYLMAGKANLIALSLGDEELERWFRRLIEVYGAWNDWLDLDTGVAKKGEEEKFEELRAEVRGVGSEVVRRIREILEEV